MVSDTLMPGLHFYQSANADTAIIKDNFVVRTHEYDIIIDDIRNNPMNGSVQHYLLLGRRGSGKSTLLKRLQIEIDTDETLQQTYVAINLAEEQANIYRLYDLLEEIIQELEYRNIEVEKPDWDPGENSFSRKLFDAIHAAIEKSGKKVILLLDNIDRIFENLKEDAGLLREMLLNYSDVKIIGGSTRMTEHFWKYNQPFYQFFRVLEMKPLTSDEIKKLLLHWSEKLDLPILKEFVEKRTGQLETIRILTDGLPRTLQFFLNILIKKTHETGYEYLRLIMDQVTPLYQERLNNLPPSQRKIVLQMAFIWESAGAKELAEASRMDNKLISAQLKQLIDKGIAEKVETKTKNHLYRLSERFFNLWLIFTQGSPAEKRKAKCLTIFLENFYDEEDLRNQVLGHLEALKGNKLMPNTAAILTKAYAQSKFISVSERDSLIMHTRVISNVNEDLKRQIPLTSEEIYSDVFILIGKRKWKDAIERINSIEQEDPSRYDLLGILYEENRQFSIAEENYLLAIRKGSEDALLSLGAFYINQGKIELAEKTLFLAKGKGVKGAEQKLGILYERQNKPELAEKFFLEAFKSGDIIGSLNLGLHYSKQNKFDLAEKYLLPLLTNVANNDYFTIAVASLYYNFNKKRSDALKLITSVNLSSISIEVKLVTLFGIKLWCGEIEGALNDILQVINQEEYDSFLNVAFSNALIHHQTNFVWQLFNKSEYSNEMMIRFQLIYHTINIIYNLNSLKTPPELQETTNIFVNYIKEKQIFYYGSSQITISNN